MIKVHPHKVGLVLGAFLGSWHLLWSLLVALAWAQPLMDFIFWIHFINPVYHIGVFDAGRAAMLIIVTAAIGYAMGFAGAHLWNRIHK